jgi:hypothetical protein
MGIHVATYCNVDGQSGVFTVPCRPDPTRPEPRQAGPRRARCYTRVASDVTGCYATLDKQSLSALGSDVTYTSQLHSTQRCYGDESTVLGYHVTPCVAMVKTVYWTVRKKAI